MAWVRVKAGVQPRLVHLVAGLANAATRANLPEVTITSAMDSTHAANSLHYALRAIDIRTRTLTASQLERLLAELLVEWGQSVDLVVEGTGTPNAHLHVEWDP